MPENIMQAINEIIPEVMSVIALVVIYYVKVLIDQWKPKVQGMIDANVNKNTQEIIKGLGRECLAYAEKEFPKSSGAEKLNEATRRFNARAIQLGLPNISSDTARTAIEQAWLEIWGTAPKAEAADTIPDAISAGQLKALIDKMAAQAATPEV